MRIASFLLLLFSSGCTNPLESSSIQTTWVDPALLPGFHLSGSNGQGVRAIRLVPLPSHISAQYRTSQNEIWLNSQREWEDETVAAVIVHELAHVRGVAHDCADGVRDRAGTYGAWFLHAATLERLGKKNEAELIRQHQFCAF